MNRSENWRRSLIQIIYFQEPSKNNFGQEFSVVFSINSEDMDVNFPYRILKKGLFSNIFYGLGIS